MIVYYNNETNNVVKVLNYKKYDKTVVNKLKSDNKDVNISIVFINSFLDTDCQLPECYVYDTNLNNIFKKDNWEEILKDKNLTNLKNVLLPKLKDIYSIYVNEQPYDDGAGLRCSDGNIYKCGYVSAVKLKNEYDLLLMSNNGVVEDEKMVIVDLYDKPQFLTIEQGKKIMLEIANDYRNKFFLYKSTKNKLLAAKNINDIYKLNINNVFSSFETHGIENNLKTINGYFKSDSKHSIAEF